MRIDHKATARQKLDKRVKASADIAALRNATPEEVDAWVDAQGNTKASLKAIARLLTYLLNRQENT